MTPATAPQTPNPYTVAAAQSTSNIAVAVSQSWMSNANVIRPESSLVWSKVQDISVQEQKFDSNGNPTGTVTYAIPQFQSTITLTAAEQAIFNSNQTIRSDLLALGIQQLASTTSRLAADVSIAFGTLPARGTVPSNPAISSVLNIPAGLVTSVGPATSANILTDLTNTQTAIDTRVQYLINLRWSNKITELNNAGLFAGMPAYDREMATLAFETNDQQLQAWLSAQQEQSRYIRTQVEIGTFSNVAQEQAFRQGMLQVDFSNKALFLSFQALLEISRYVTNLREDQRNEILLLRRTELSELVSILHGGQPSIPQFQGFQAGHISDTPLASSVYNSAALAQQSYQYQNNQQQQLLGGALGLAGNLLTAPGIGF